MHAIFNLRQTRKSTLLTKNLTNYNINGNTWKNTVNSFVFGVSFVFTRFVHVAAWTSTRPSKLLKQKTMRKDLCIYFISFMFVLQNPLLLSILIICWIIFQNGKHNALFKEIHYTWTYNFLDSTSQNGAKCSDSICVSQLVIHRQISVVKLLHANRILWVPILLIFRSY